MGLDVNIKAVERDGTALFYSNRESSKCEAGNAQQLIKTCGRYGLMTICQGTPGFVPPRTLHGLRQWQRERDTPCNYLMATRVLSGTGHKAWADQ